MDKDFVIAEAMHLLEAEPLGEEGLDIVPVPQFAAPGIPALRGQLAMFVSTGRAKEAIGVQLRT